MQIEFNTDRIPRVEPAQPNGMPVSTPAASDAVSLTNSDSLKVQLSNLPTSRSEEVARATGLISQKGYPPDDVLDRIATLIAAKIQDNASDQSGQSC